jgi:Fe-S-cluster containining protein
MRYARTMTLPRPSRDQELIQIVDAALVDASRKAGAWIACRPGCTQCCVGAFAINALDASRLREGLSELRRSDPGRASAVLRRAQSYLDRVRGDFPGNAETGVLDSEPESQLRFEDFANDEVCPALDPESGTCDLYDFRPMTCRVFGPPVKNEGGGLGICELCFHGATPKQIAACEMKPDPHGMEETLLQEFGVDTAQEETIVAFVLAEQTR